MDTEPLFYMLRTLPYETGHRVVAQTIWGDEPGQIIAMPDPGWAKVHLDRGMVLLVSTCRLKHLEIDDAEDGVTHEQENAR